MQRSTNEKPDVYLQLFAKIVRHVGKERSLPLFLEAVGKVLKQEENVLRLYWLKCQYGDFSHYVPLQGGSSPTLPWSLLSESLDQEEPIEEDNWLVLPLTGGESFPLLLLVEKKKVEPFGHEEGRLLADLVSEVISEHQYQLSQQQKISRLEAILEIAAQWNKTQEMDALLFQMAAAATKLLDAERASIFLWDKPNKQLVGKPALGVEGGELRVNDESGVVGKVVQQGIPVRIDRQGEQEHIDRSVDKAHDFHTETILCVPLLGSDQKILGAFELLNKKQGDFTDHDKEALVELADHAVIAIENTQQSEHLLNSRKQITQQAASQVQPLIGESAVMRSLQATVDKVAGTELAVLVLGENGTGKEVVSQLIHYQSRRREEPFIAVNCAALPETLLESELFGHEKGAFTGAAESRAGKFELASGGTIFLDEIGDMSLGGQAKLLRVLEDKRIVRVGGAKEIYADVRVVAATNQDLLQMVQEKKFREDLYFRLNVVSLQIPALRDRGDDILLLADYFLQSFCLRARREPLTLDPSAKEIMLGYRWPGNVRELRNQMERIAYLVSEKVVTGEELSMAMGPAADRSFRGDIVSCIQGTLVEATAAFQKSYIQQVIDKSDKNISVAAKTLGVHRSNLYRKMKALDMET
ncbi:MAG: sigma 54-interacting transcriptional regulator [Pirellulaceae bacterium]|nr:sigma 54-interacting transcriptional regulator [Pirellulaceae bacterium]